jgi:hypothetical protein
MGLTLLKRLPLNGQLITIDAIVQRCIGLINLSPYCECWQSEENKDKW